LGKGGDAISKNIRSHLRIEPVRRLEHLSLNLCEFRFFNSNKQGTAMPFGNSRFLPLLIPVPYILACEVISFRNQRFFVKLRNRVVGLLILNEKPDALRISSLAVAPEFRRLGIASYILSYAERIAEMLDKEFLELSVLKKNLPSRTLYRNSGFSQKEERKRSFILVRKVQENLSISFVFESSFENLKLISHRQELKLFPP
jgi:GNAT superfamily N-acetyltransferase